LASDGLVKLVRRYRLKPEGVIHVGAHVGQETDAYDAIGAHRQLWIEPQPDAFQRLKERAPPSELVHHANVACGSTPGRMELNIIPKNGGGLSSLLAPTQTLREMPESEVIGTQLVDVQRLDDVIQSTGIDAAKHNLLVVDTQGFELEVLRGAVSYLAKDCDYIYAEISRVPLYEGSCLESDIDAFLRPFAFRRVYTRLSLGEHGDALYVRAPFISRVQRLRLSLLGPRVRRPRGRHKRALAARAWR